MVTEKEIEFKKYEECVNEYKELLEDLTSIKEGNDLPVSEFGSRCNDLIEKFKTIKYLGILEEQARAMAINDLSKFISEAKDIQNKE
ncbi:hypothetical protein [Methanobacterium spitsbergense]|uniref:Uncharacterized protein n=1 Tax=Methanobacterium spitsbergense TaxID=2874285 RepID=A0A8T5UNS1_9EURY|nr:hypothetical protein [Methanobacterium spitsbergense]MBZ2165458.1 hypothetical protein [Methanobacterium spitsbergense]